MDPFYVTSLRTQKREPKPQTKHFKNWNHIREIEVFFLNCLVFRLHVICIYLKNFFVIPLVPSCRLGLKIVELLSRLYNTCFVFSKNFLLCKWFMKNLPSSKFSYGKFAAVVHKTVIMWKFLKNEMK
jgi:hypothetical protein